MAVNSANKLAANSMPSQPKLKPTHKLGYWRRLGKDFKVNYLLYLMVLPVVAYYALFHYGPMYGAQIAFKAYAPIKGIFDSPWVGLEHFQSFFQSFYFWRVLKNTLLINLYELLFAFPAPIILAVMLNEVRKLMFKRVVQTITYLPHFISIVVIAGMVIDFFSLKGLVNDLLSWFNIAPVQFMTEPGWFRTLFIGSGIWQGVGWGSIIYLAAISGIDPSLYEASRVDGAGRIKQIWHITLPGIAPTIIILFILNIGHFMSVGAEKVLLLYNPMTYETADTISTYVYRKGLLEFSFSFSAAVGLFNSVINFGLLIFANRMSRKLTDTKLW